MGLFALSEWLSLVDLDKFNPCILCRVQVVWQNTPQIKNKTKGTLHSFLKIDGILLGIFSAI